MRVIKKISGTFSAILDPLTHVSFGDTVLNPPTLPREVIFSIYQITSFF